MTLDKRDVEAFLDLSDQAKSLPPTARRSIGASRLCWVQTVVLIAIAIST
jgi:hypothetical protein